MGFGRSFLRGFSWGVGRGVAYNLTRTPRRGRKPLTDKQRYERAEASRERAQVQAWINEAVRAYQAEGVQHPTFAQIRAYVRTYHHYKLTK
jgi:hypothetical protein